MFTLRIAKIGSHQTVDFAVNELYRYLKLMDKRLPIDQRTVSSDGDDMLSLYVGLSPRVAPNKLDDEILIDVRDGVGIITGASERAVLIAVYRFLRELGCRWIRPGDGGEVIPKKDIVTAELNAHVMNDPVLWKQIMDETLIPKWASAEEIAEWAYFVTVVNRSMTAQDVLIDNGEAARSNFIW